MGKFSMAMKAKRAVGDKAVEFLSRNKTALANAMERTKLTSPGSLYQAIKTNPGVAALVALEMGSAGLELLNMLEETDPALANMVNTASAESPRYQPDDVQLEVSYTIAQIAGFQDEFNAIDGAAASLGGLDRLLQLRNVLKMSDDTFIAYNVLGK